LRKPDNAKIIRIIRMAISKGFIKRRFPVLCG